MNKPESAIMKNRDLSRNVGVIHRMGKRLSNVSTWVSAIALIVLTMTLPCRAADFVIVVDTSGSMTSSVNKRDTRVRISVVQDALRQYLPALPVGSRVDLIAFSTGITSEKEFILKDSKELENALEWVDNLSKGIRQNNQTYLWTTLRHALRKASEYTRECPDQTVTVRALTDGEDNEKVTTLDAVLKEFLPVLDGEKIRGNLILLGDLELTTKLTLPDGAFEATRNATWEELFPPVVLCAPSYPKVGEDVKVFENNTRSIYRDYEWMVDGTLVGREKVLTWRFTEPRSYRVMLKATGLQGTKTSASIQVKVQERERLAVDFTSTVSDPEPLREFRVMGRCNNGQAEKFAWYVNGVQMATTQDTNIRLEKEGKHEVRLVVWNAAGDSGSKERSFHVKEKELAANISGPAEAVSGQAVQLVGEITGPCVSVEWSFDDGSVSSNRNPEHVFELKDAEYKDFKVRLRTISLFGKTVESAPHTVRVWAEKKYDPPCASFRMMSDKIRVGDPVQIINESTGLVEARDWCLDGKTVSRDQNPVITCEQPGQKQLCLTVRGPGGESSVSNTLFITPRFVQPSAACEASRLEGTAPLYVQFKAKIKGDYRSLLWAFGDGSSSTNPTPQHAFTASTNFVVTLTVHPMDSGHSAVVKTLTVKVIRPWPLWAKAGLTILPFLILGTVVSGVIRARRRKALRLPVYFWPEQVSTCQTVILTKADEAVDLAPLAAIRIQRVGRSQDLVVKPIQGAKLFTSDGTQKDAIAIAEGVVVTICDRNAFNRAIAISPVRKPCRPKSDSAVGESLPDESSFCGLQIQSDDASLRLAEDTAWLETATQSSN